MSTKSLVLLTVIGAPIVAAIAAYAGLVYDGSVPPPDLSAVAQNIDLGTKTLAQILLIIGIAAACMLAVIAPVVFSIRAADPLTILISLAMTGAAIAMLFISRTVLDQISALIIYLANITLSAIVYAAHRIAPNAK